VVKFASVSIIGGQTNGQDSNTRRVGPFCAGNPAAASSDLPMPYAGQLSDIVAHVNIAPGAAASGKAWDVAVMLNGVATAHTGTIFETADRCVIAGPVAIAYDDELAVLFTAVNVPAGAVKGWAAKFTEVT